jgi:hypothetical protein
MSSTRRGITILGAVVIGTTTLLAMAVEEPPVPPPAGETINVTGFADTAEPDVQNCMASADLAYDIECPTLREAVMYANGSLLPSMDTINLPAGTYTLSTVGVDEVFAACVDGDADAPAVTNIPDAGTGDLDITDSVIINGAGPDRTVVEWPQGAAEADRVFHVYNATGDVFADFNGLRVSHGMLLEEFLCQGPPTTLEPPPVPELPTAWVGRRAGGGIAVGPAANTVLDDPNITGDENSAGRGGSQKPGDPGGEIGGTYTVTLTEVVLDTNMSDGDGGGLYNSGPLTANRIGIIGNISGTNGGGIYNEGMTLIDTAIVQDNQSEGGGGIFATGNPDVPVDILNSTFSGNQAVGGGAISGRVVPINVTNSTISGNTGVDVGGGIYSNGVVALAYVTIADNRAIGAEAFGGAGINVFNSALASVTLIDTLLSNNTAGSGVEGPPRDANCGCTGNQPDCVLDAPARKIMTLGFNLSDDTSCNLDAVGDQTEGIDPMIGPLADNGGLTMTHKLLAGSLAIDNGIAIEGITTDQRGYTRGRKPDIGAYEVSLVYAGGGGGGGCSMRTAATASVDPLLALMLLSSAAWIGSGRRQKSRE